MEVDRDGWKGRAVDPMDAFAQLMARDDEVELDRAAFLFAAVEYPNLDVAAGLRELDHLAGLLRPRVAGERSPADVVRTTGALLHGELGFAGNQDAYYDPCNSYLNDVLRRRLGIPISLSALYLEVGRRLGLPFEGVGMPGHFLVRYRHATAPVLFDPFAGGTIVGEAECENRLRGLYGPAARLRASMLEAVGTRAIVFRMLNNLKGVYASQGDWQRVIRTIDLMLMTHPGAITEHRDRGAAHLRTGDLRRARADFEHYLLNATEIADAVSVREQLALVDRLEAMRN
jgi:regulator of sirC expression with transglutaminase-like and TPR domain